MTYALGNAWDLARTRLSLLEACLDSKTLERVNRLKVERGAVCLEVGAGRGSLLHSLAEMVGTSGRVVATDVDTRFLQTIDVCNVEVWEHDVVADPLPASQFDFIHARWLLYHLPQPSRVVEKLVRALRPGGVFLVEDVDFFPLAASPSPHFVRFMEALAAEVGAASFHDGYWAARRIPELLFDQRMMDVEIDVELEVLRGGTAMSQFWSLTAQQLRDRLLTGGRLTPAAFEEGAKLLDESRFWSYSTANLGVSARRHWE